VVYISIDEVIERVYCARRGDRDKIAFSASETIYEALKKGSGLKVSTTSNESGDDQLELDVFADEAFFETLRTDRNVRYVVSEERIPSGAIFGIWENAEVAKDFSGKNIIGGGFFVFGMNLEAYFADGPNVT